MMTQDANVTILFCLRKQFEPETYAKFQRVLEFVGEENVMLLSNIYDTLLKNKLRAVDTNAFPPDYGLSEYAYLKTKYISFRFIGQLGRCILKDYDVNNSAKYDQNLVKLMKILLHHALIARNDTSNFALVELSQLCALHNLTLTKVYQKYRCKLLKVIIKAILRKLENHDDENCSAASMVESGHSVNGNVNGNSRGRGNCVARYINQAFEIFGESTIVIQDIAQSLVIITYLLSKDRYLEPSKLFVKHLASFQRLGVAQLLRYHIQAIMVNILLEGKMSSYDLNESLKKLCAIADKKNPYEILETKLTNIKGRILLNYSIDKKKTTDAIYYLSTWEQNELDQPFEDQFEEESSFIEYLSPSMVGILLGIDSYFNSSLATSDPNESIKHIESLSLLISMLEDKQVSIIHHKILSTLSLILRLRPVRDNPQLNSIIVDVWHAFIRKLNKDLLDALMINICVALYNLIQDCPELVSRLYNHMFSGLHGKHVKRDKLEILFFIPKAPGFEKIYESLEAYVSTAKSNLVELESAIDCVFPLMKLENRQGHVLAVARIRDLLKSNRDLIMSAMLANQEESLNHVLSKTIECLLALLSTQECSALIAECLGTIGAINPVRLTHLIYGDIGETDCTFISISSEKFIIRLIEKLKNSLLSDRRSETASYALQEVVSTYRIFQTKDLLHKLSEPAKKACDMCRKTGYAGIRRSPPDTSVPLYIKFKNEAQYSYKEWLDRFFLVLISLLKDDKAQGVLHACAYNFKENLKLAEYLLPIVITNIIINQSTSLELIEKELMAIITDDIGVSSQDLDTVYRANFEHSLQTLHFQCANIVFCLLDYMTGMEKSLKTMNINRNQLTRWQAFINSLPKDKLAILASKCRAHARSLFYFDQYYFDTKNWDWKQSKASTNFDKYWTSLQRVFMALDDTQEAAGIQMRRTSPTTVTDDIANFESAGRFDKAILHYESLLDATNQNMDKKQLLEDALKCLSHLGQHQRLYERSKQLVEQYPQFKRSIVPYAIEAFCKLGKWDELNETITNGRCDSLLDSTQVCQGLLLGALKGTDDNSNLEQRLTIVKESSIKPLSIAMIDRSAYFRGYQNLLVLHSIEDFALALDVIKSKSFKTQRLDENTTEVARDDLIGRLKTLIATWNKRNRLVQPSMRSLEPLLAWQRSIALILMERYPFVKQQLCVDVGHMWLASADTAREARCFDRSFYSLVQAQKWFGSDLLKSNLEIQVKCTIVQAKLDWDQGESTDAIRCLNSAIHRLQNHYLYQHLDGRKSKSVDARRKTNNPYQHPDDELYPDISSDQDCDDCALSELSERESFAKLKLLLTRYTEEAAAVTPRSLLSMYEDCVHLGVNQEEVFLLLARYYDKLANYYTENPQALKLSDRLLDASCESQDSFNGRIVRIDRNSTGKSRKSSSQDKKDKELAHKEDVISKLMEQSILAFGNSLKHGVRYLEESMPRMLNIWFDLGSKKCLETMAYYPRAINSRIESTVRLIDTLVFKKDARNNLPSYYFIAALSLLLSRVCHPHMGICEKTAKILEQLLIDYPHQMMWRLAAMINDDYEERRHAAEKIIKQAVKRNPKLHSLTMQYRRFIDLMRKACKNYTELDPRGSQFVKSKKLSSGPHHIRDIEPACENFLFREKTLCPVQNSIHPILPTENDYDNLKQYNIYPDHYLSFIREISTEAYVFNSMQQPRRIDLHCENGKKISILCKSLDDLRKDSRCMEFFNLLNKILRRDSQSSSRFFEIGTFLVVPLESRAGIIEMVPNVETLRSIVEKLYREKHGMNFQLTTLIKKRLSKDPNTDADAYNTFVEKVLPRVTPPVFQQFFHKRFTEPISWYMARQAYSRSLALTSMVGYIVGLGDRHLDNVLIDIKQGRVIHVDMNLLFHQADNLPVPEVVPFRLTHNLVAALGPMGTEGSFRKFSEIAMRVMRKEKELLLTTLKPFLHDPCCEWIKEREQNRGVRDKEQERDGNKVAKDRIEVVDRKLKGFPRPGKVSKPLTVLNAFSVEAQVDILIEEATDLFALSQMYHGWAPHI